jgi:hypothetical protein
LLFGSPDHERNEEIKTWLQDLLRSGIAVRVPEIADYEIRRELLRAGKSKGLKRLYELKIMSYVPLTYGSDAYSC